MSNASNLSTFANVLDDANAGEFLKSTGSGGVAFDTVAAGATVYSNASDLPLTGNTVGDMAYVSAATTAKVVNQATGSVSTEDATRLYIYSGTGWYSVAFITQNPTINTVQDAGGGSTPFTLATDGTTATVVTITANDPESVPLTYSYGITNGALNGCTITGADGTSARVAGTAYTDNVFTVTPHASNDATFIITFTASDGINQATSANAFSLTFITTVTDSNHTTLLATATGTSDNNNITYIDGSGNTQNATVNGDAYAGTFSPHRSGGYATSFSRSNSSKLEIASMPAIGSGDCSIECWINIESSSAEQGIIVRGVYNSVGGFALTTRAAGGELMLLWSGSIYVTSGANIVADKWHWIQVIRSSGTVTIYVNGSSVGSWSNSSNVSSTSTYIIGRADSYFGGQIRDLRISTNAQSSSNGSEKLATDSNTTFLSCHLPYLSYATSSVASNSYSSISGTIKTVPFSPYDYAEYSATDHGGSVYFDGTGDYLQTSSILPAGAFTVSCWAYFNTSNADAVWSQGTSGNAARTSIQMLGSSLFFGIGSTNVTSSSGSILPKIWYYIEAQYSGSQIELFINGSSVGSNSNTTNPQNSNFHVGTLGSSWDSSYELDGYISDLKIVSGTPSGSSTVPTAPLSSSGAELHIKGTDASIIDKSQSSNLKLFSNTTGSTDLGANSDAYSGSGKYIKFDGTGDYIISQEPVLLGTQDFTVECWLYYQSGLEFMGNRTLTDAGGFSVRITSTSITVGNSSGSGFGSVFSGTTSSLTNAWHHISVSRSSGVTKIYVDGSSIASHSSAINFSLSNPFVIGYSYSNGSGSDSLQGYIQDFRITNGYPRYTAADETANIPTAPLEG